MAIINKPYPQHQPKYLLLWTPKWLKTRYEKDGLSTYQIAELVGCRQSNVVYVMNRLGIKFRKYTMSKMAKLARAQSGINKRINYVKKGKENAIEGNAGKN